jgi:MFS transporter, putative metabolite transport protein
MSGAVMPQAVEADRALLRRAVFLCSAGGFVDGYDLLIMGAALLQIVPTFHLKPFEVGWLTSLPFLFMGIGALVAGRICDLVGRRTVYLIDITLFVIFSLLQAVAQEYWQLVVMRALIGFAIGMDMPTGSSMLAEYAPPEKRGGITTMINTAWLFGGFVAAVAGYVLYAAVGEGAWRWMFALGAVPALVIAVMRHGLPESPYWAREAERRVVASADTGFGAILRSRYWKVVLFFTAYMVIQAMAGGPPFVYTALIFNQVVSFSGANALLLNAGLLLAYSVLSIGLQFTALERWGRKPFAIAATGLAALGAFATAWLQHAGVPLVFTFFAFAVGVQMSTIPFWPWSVEQLPTRIRATGQSIGSAGAKISQFLGVLIFTPGALAGFGWTPYFIGVAIAFLVLVIGVAIFGPETRAKPLEA